MKFKLGKRDLAKIKKLEERMRVINNSINTRKRESGCVEVYAPMSYENFIKGEKSKPNLRFQLNRRRTLRGLRGDQNLIKPEKFKNSKRNQQF